MKIKIVNRKKFMKLPAIILGILFICILLLTNNSSSNTKTAYKTIYVSKGETLWYIANEQSKNNQYYKDYDIRDIVQNIKEINGLADANIFVGKELKIPSYK